MAMPLRLVLQAGVRGVASASRATRHASACLAPLPALAGPAVHPPNHRLGRRYAASAAQAAPTPAPGWHPETSVKHEDEPDARWTPTGTGGYPADWAAINESEWAPGKMRCGAIGVKLGMTMTWDAWGERIPLTAIHLEDCQVVEARTKEKHGVDGLVVGCKNRRRNNVLRQVKAAQKQFVSRKLPLKHAYRQFKVSPDGMLPEGHFVTADHFVPGQYVDVIGKTIGKGFAGVMKRHNMKGGNASHGATKMHRKMGATGGGQDPGRIWPGKRMAGRMGNQTIITHSLQLHKIDTRWNILYVKGAVPGAPGTTIAVTDARRKNRFVGVLPYPTAASGQVPAGIHVVTPPDRDPGTVIRK